MRHNKNFNHLSRTHSHRAALLSNMACSLIKHKRIFTTLPKAKALRMYVEPLLTKAKTSNVIVVNADGSAQDKENIQRKAVIRRDVFSYLQNKEAVTILFDEIASKIKDRKGGYTRIIKTGFRLGDAADTCFIELVDYDENMLSQKVAKKSSRTRRSSKKKDVAEQTAETESASTEVATEEANA